MKHLLRRRGRKSDPRLRSCDHENSSLCLSLRAEGGPSVRHKLSGAFAVVLAASITAPASAQVVYTFTANSSPSGPTGTFTYTSPDFITADLTVSPGQLDSCVPSIGSCGDQTFYPDNTTLASPGIHDVIAFDTDFG